MSTHAVYKPQHPVMQWLERRLPIASLVYSSFIVYPTPRNLNYWWTFGGILTFMLAAQMVTGIVLAMHYRRMSTSPSIPSNRSCATSITGGYCATCTPTARHSSLSPSTLTSRAACTTAPTRTRARYCGSSALSCPAHGRHRLMGYVLPSGTDELFGSNRHHQPVLGHTRRRRSNRDLAVGWLRRRQPNAEPFLFAALSVAVRHCRRGGPARLGAAHGGAKPIRPVSSPRPRRILFVTPYATMKDAFFIGVFCLFFAWFVFYIPDYLGHSDNYIPANPGQTPTHIVPEWYYLPFRHDVGGRLTRGWRGCNCRSGRDSSGCQRERGNSNEESILHGRVGHERNSTVLGVGLRAPCAAPKRAGPPRRQ